MTKCKCLTDGPHGEDFGTVRLGNIETEPCTNHLALYLAGGWDLVDLLMGGERYSVKRETVMPTKYVGGNPWVDRWAVDGSKGDTYTVGRRADGTFGCSCPGWKFAKAPKPDCKHIVALRQAFPEDKSVAQRRQVQRRQELYEQVKTIISRKKYGSDFRADVSGVSDFRADVSGSAEPRSVQVDTDIFTVRRKIRLED